MPPAFSIRTAARQCEVAWFSALCSDDYEFLGVPDGSLRSNYEHCGEIVKKADALGYQNILLPSGWIAGQDALAFAAAMAPQTQQINQLVALRMGEVWPPMLARALATVDHIAKGRLCIKIISSDMPGTKESNEVRYARASEIIQILQGLWRTDGPFEWKGEFYQISLPTTEPANTRVLAENVIALVVYPHRSPNDPVPSGSPTQLAPLYFYDSRSYVTKPTDATALLTRNQLPPMVQITMVVMDERSAERFQASLGAAPQTIAPATEKLGLTTGTTGLFVKASTISNPTAAQEKDQYTLDLATLEKKLQDLNLTYRIFSTDVSILQAKWSE